MPLYIVASTPHVHSPDAIALRAKTTRLDQVGQQRALKVLNDVADQFLATVAPDAAVVAPLSKAERLERAIAEMRACGALKTVAALERLREGTHG